MSSSARNTESPPANRPRVGHTASVLQGIYGEPMSKEGLRKAYIWAQLPSLNVCGVSSLRRAV